MSLTSDDGHMTAQNSLTPVFRTGLSALLPSLLSTSHTETRRTFILRKGERPLHTSLGENISLGFIV